MKYKSKKQEEIFVSNCCEDKLIYNGYVGLTFCCHTCIKCGKRCKVKRITKTVFIY